MLRFRRCRLEPLEDRRLLSVTGFELPEISAFGPIQALSEVRPFMPVNDKSFVIDWTEVQPSTTSKDVLYNEAEAGGDGITNYYAVTVGITDYPGTANDLNYPALDAQAMRDTLLTGTNWRPENITLLQNSEATRAAVLDAIGQMGAMADVDDVCLFYYSGHGTQVGDVAPYDESDGLDEVLVTYDFDTAGVLTDDLLLGTMNNLPTDQFLVVLDCCQSAGGYYSAKDTIVDGIGEDLLVTTTTNATKNYDPGQGVVVTSCAEGQLSSESDQVGLSLFTYNFLEGLLGWADVNDNGWVSAEECFDFAEYGATIQDPAAQPTLFDYHLGELPLVQLASPMPEVVYYEDFASLPTGWVTADNDADGSTWSWAADGTMYTMANPGYILYPEDGLGSPLIDCSDYDNLFLRMEHNITDNGYTDFDLDVVDSASQRTTVWSMPYAETYDLNAAVDITTVAAGDSAVSMEWWFMGEVYPGEVSMWELIEVELRASDTKDVRVSVLDQGAEDGSPVRARVDVLAAPLTDLVITLGSEDENQVTTPVSVTIPAGQTTAEFYLTMVDDSLCDGTQNVLITASAADYLAGTDTIEILDDEPERIDGDINLDGHVDASDATILAGNWQSTTGTWLQGDLNGDGNVDASDATILAGNWQASVYVM
ncbi:MAG: caspase family protein [Planctomycetia bacterium]